MQTVSMNYFVKPDIFQLVIFIQLLFFIFTTVVKIVFSGLFLILDWHKILTKLVYKLMADTPFVLLIPCVFPLLFTY